MTLNILSGLRRSDLRLHPFPHYIIDNVFDNETYNHLDNSFPNLSLLYQDSPDNVVNDRNHTLRLLKRQVHHATALSSAWTQLSNLATSPDFFDARTHVGIGE